MKRKLWLASAMALALTAAFALPAGAVVIEEDEVVIRAEEESAVMSYSSAAFLSVGETVSKDGVTYSISDGVASVVGYTGEIGKNCVIPASVEGYSVTSLADSAFYNCSQIETISLPDTIAGIGSSAFQGCTNLTEITIPASVEMIGDTVFNECYALTQIDVSAGNPSYHSEDGVLFDTAEMTLMQYPIGRSDLEYTMPDGVLQIAPRAFFQAECLENVVLADSVTVIGESAFEGCFALKQIDLGESLEIVENDVFVDCGKLQTLSFPATLMVFEKSHGMSGITAYEVRGEGGVYSSDEDGVLYSGTVLIAYPSGAQFTEFTVPDGTTSIDDEAFWDAENLTQIHFPATLERIGWGAFTGTGLTSVVIPDSVTEIETYAFQSNSSLASVTLGNGITELDSGVFSNCRKLTEITIPASVNSIDEKTFQNCRGLENIYVAEGSEFFVSVDGILYSADKSKLLMVPAAKQNETMNLPAEVTEVSYGALSGISTLRSITVTEGNTVYYAQDGVLFEHNTDEDGNAIVILHTYPQSKQDASYTIPDGVSVVAEKAFEDHEYIGSVSLNEVLEVREDGFGDTWNLTRVDLGNVKILGQSAFIGSGLTAVTIPASVTYMDTQTFDYCNNLDHVVFLGEIPPESMRMMCLNSENVRYIYVPVGTQVEYKVALTGHVWPGAMIVEGTYIPEETLTEKIENLTDESTVEEINEVAAGIVRLTANDVEQLADDAISLVEELFKQIHAETLSAEVLTDVDVLADGLALASGLVERQAEDGTVSGDVTLMVTDMTDFTGDVLSLEFVFSVNGEDTQPKSPIIITATIPEGADLSALQLVHVNEYGDEEIIPFTLDGQQATFRADEFSTYTFREGSGGGEIQEPRVEYSVDHGGLATLYLAGYDAETNQLCSMEICEIYGDDFVKFWPEDGIVYKAFILDDDTFKPVGTAEIIY